MPVRDETWYERVIEALNRAGAEYLIAGGMALNLHGVSRLTKDLDLYFDWGPENVRKIVRTLGALGFKLRQPIDPELLADPKERERLRAEKNVKAFTFILPDNPYEVIDLLLVNDPPFRECASRVVRLRSGTVPVVSIPDLIRMKKEASRSQDLLDIRALERILELQKERK